MTRQVSVLWAFKQDYILTHSLTSIFFKLILRIWKHFSKTYIRAQQTSVYVWNLACGLFLEIKFYWNRTTPIHLYIVYGSFVTMAEMNGCNRDLWPTKSKMFNICPTTEKVWGLLVYLHCFVYSVYIPKYLLSIVIDISFLLRVTTINWSLKNPFKETN